MVSYIYIKLTIEKVFLHPSPSPFSFYHPLLLSRLWFRKTRGETCILTKYVTVLAATICVILELILTHTVIHRSLDFSCLLNIVLVS